MAESSRRKVVCTNDKDIISELPGNIQETILDFLPIRDAVRTSILSRKWRHCWTMIPRLLFEGPSMSDQISRYKDPKLKAYEFGVVNKVLLLHSGPILKFSLGILEVCDLETVGDFINHWIALLSSNGIKQLTLENWQRRGFTMYNFDAYHISCLDLTHLKFRYVHFQSTPAFGGFTCMTNLVLTSVAVTEGVIFDCPVLENLTIISCTQVFHTNFRAPNLKSLHERNFQIPLTGLENLTEFSFCRLGSPSLECPEKYNVVMVFGCLHKIETFSAGYLALQNLAAGGSPNRLSKPLPCLKNLNIANVYFGDLSEVSCLLCLIRSAPNLRKLQISSLRTIDGEKRNFENYWAHYGSGDDDNDEGTLDCVEESEDCTISQLEIVTFNHLQGLRAELERIKFLLAQSPLLRTMLIHRSKLVETNAALTMVEETMQFPRASPRAQIRHLKDPVLMDGVCTEETVARHCGSNV